MDIIKFFATKEKKLQSQLSRLQRNMLPEDLKKAIQAFLLDYETYENLKSKTLLSRLVGLVRESKENRFLIRYDKILDGKSQIIRQLRGISGGLRTLSTRMALSNFTSFARAHFIYESQTIFPAIRKILSGQVLAELGRQAEDLSAAAPPPEEAPETPEKPASRVPSLAGILLPLRRRRFDFAWKFSLIGVALGAAFPLTIFLSHLLLTFQGTWGQWWNAEWAASKEVYLYAGFGAVLLLPVFGYFLGLKNDLLKRRIESLEKTACDFQQLSIRDGLTGLYAYSHLIQRLDEELARAKRSGTPLSCLFIDIDQFKALNDTYGHSLGNRVLLDVARTMRGKIRTSDVLGRYGGDEFLVILPDTSAPDALKVAENIRSSVQEIATYAPAWATVSVGVFDSVELPSSSLDLLKSADQALRRAKSQGRNQVVLLSQIELERGSLRPSS